MARQTQKPVDAPTIAEGQRLDKWLWFARVAKTRTLAAGFVSGGRVRVNRVRTTKPAQTVRAGDVITVSVSGGVRVLEILAGGTRRGPASEAAELYNEIVPLQSSRPAAVGTSKPAGDSAAPEPVLDPALGPGQGTPVSEAGSGRPTKRDRRVLDRLRSRNDE